MRRGILHRAWRIVAPAAVAAIGWMAATVHAAEIQVFSGGAVRSVVAGLARDFEAQSGHVVRLAYSPMGMIRQKLSAGENADVLIVTAPIFDDLARQGILLAASRSDIARVGVGVAVRQGAPQPDISSTEKFKQAMLAAQSVVYMDPGKGATSGVHVAGVFNRLGIADALKPKTRLWPDGAAAEAVAKGESEIAVQQISELLPVPGVVVVGALPKDLQMVSVYAAGVTSRSAQPEAARAFVAFLARPEFRSRFAQAGMDYRE
jgi:molybdate transport system substrate-binding protein